MMMMLIELFHALIPIPKLGEKVFLIKTSIPSHNPRPSVLLAFPNGQVAEIENQASHTCHTLTPLSCVSPPQHAKKESLKSL
jgi:hypothetical protein